MLEESLLLTAIGHFLVEYPLQKTRLGKFKRKHFSGLVVHAAIWTAAIIPGLLLVDNFSFSKAFFLFSSHALIDGCKTSLKKERLSITHPVNIADQILHLLTIAVVYIT